MTFVLLLLLPAALHTQTPLHLAQLDHKTWTVSDGAPSHIYDIAVGKDGRLWLSTTYGLYTYNGVSFVPYQPPRGSVLHYAYALMTTRAGVIWGSSYLGGVLSIDDGHLRTYGPEQGLPRGGMDTAAEGPDGSIWAAGGGWLYHLRGDRWVAEPASSGLPHGEVVKVIFDHAGVEWVVTKTTLLYRTPGQTRFLPTLENWGANSFVCTLIESPSDQLWIALDDVNAERSVVRTLDVPGHPAPQQQTFSFPYEVQDAKFDRTGTLWISGHGLARISFPAGQPAVAKHEALDPAQGFTSAETRSLLPAANGDLWLTTLHGLERFRQPQLIKWNTHPSDTAARPDVAAGIAGRVWIGAGNGPLVLADRANITNVGPSLDSFFCMFGSRDGSVWFNSRKGLWQETPEGTLTAIPVPPGIFFQDLRQVVELGDGTLLFSFREKGVWSRHAGVSASASDAWTPLHLPEQPSVMYVDSRGALWGGFISGRVSRLNGSSWSVSNPDLGSIYALLQLPQGLLVSGERGLALLRDGQLTTLRFADGLGADGISGMVQSPNGDLWLNGAHGVLHVAQAELAAGLAVPQPRPMQADLLTEPDIRGPAPFLYDMPTAARDGAGRIWFVTSDTVVYVDPSQLRPAHALPTLSLMRAEADGKPLDLDKVQVPAGIHTLRLAYFATYLTAPEKVRYRYKLDGIDDTWQDVGERTEAVYTKLPPGRYQFHVIASSGGDRWTSPASLTVRKLPTFYETRTFLGVCVALLLGLAVLIYQVRVRYLTARLRERADERLNERMRIARDLHDTLLQGVQGLMMSFHVAIQRVPAGGPVREALEGALDKADLLVIEGRDRISQLRTDSLDGLTLTQAIRGIAVSGEAVGPAHITVRLLSDERPLQGPVADELFVIAREAITNAYRHANARTIGVDLDFARRTFRLVCHDDGRGFSPQDGSRASYTGHFGLPSMRERATKLGATFALRSAPGEGTRITLTLPARQAYVGQSFTNRLLRRLRWVPRRREA